MNITSKSRYALKILMDLAERDPTGTGAVAQRTDISKRQGIPLDYMDHVLSRLREAGLIASTRGRGGGYRLSTPADRVSVLEIFTAVEDSFQPVQCLEGGAGCVLEHQCSSRDAWSEISAAISASLSGIILADLVAKRSHGQSLSSALPMMAFAMKECRAPSQRR